MPIGGFLDSLPSLLFIGAHVAFLIVGVWAIRSGRGSGAAFAPFIWLYVVSQVVFLAFFGGVITMKMAVLLEQTLIVLMVAAIASRNVVAR
ncbi:MAG TPA: hypothetical protein VLT86_07145 [Vicinamibacterales bacterium]|nr:hypothetical protein [Vicinamibacterales bacterium]